MLCLGQGTSHFFKSRKTLTNKFFVNHFNDFIFIDYVKLVDLERLFKEALFDLYDVAVVPCKERDFACDMWNFFDDSHIVSSRQR